MSQAVLEGVRVLDLIDGPGAYGPRLLAGFGADVIRVEPPGGARDRWRGSPWHREPVLARPGAYFVHYNAGKRSVTLDIGEDAGREDFQRLLASATIVMDNGHLARAGFDVDSLIERESPLVVVSVTPFGVVGPRAHWLGPDIVVQAMSSMVGYYGYRNERPVRFGAAQSEQMTGLAAALGALLALRGARNHGCGDFVDITAERVCALTSFQMSNPSLHHQFGFERTRTPRAAGLPAGVYEAKDGYYAFNAWRDAAETVEFLIRHGADPGLRERLATLGAAFQQDPVARQAVAAFVAGGTQDELTETIQSEGLMALPINDVERLLADHFLATRKYFVDVTLPGGTTVKDSGPPVRLHATPMRLGGAVPEPGAHNAQVLDQSASPPSPPPSATGDAGRPLQGVRILDLSWLIAGPLATRLLADFGAEVIKIESRLRMDIGRANRVPLFGVLPGDANTNPDTGGYFHDANASKLSCTINLGNEHGRELLRRLVAISDVMLCNLAGDQFDKWGLGYETARAINPGIIMVNMPSMQSTGPKRNWRGFGDTFVGLAGLKSISGNPGEPPLPWGHQYADFSSNPYHAAIAIMVALEHRRRTGEGQFIEVSQFESTTALMGEAFVDYGMTGEMPSPPGNHDPDACPHNFYRCSGDDSWCAIAILDDAQWRALAQTTGIPELRNPDFNTLAGRRSAEAQIDAAIEEWTANRDRHDVAELLQAAGVPAGALQTTPDLIHRDPTMGANHFIAQEHPSGREFLIHGNPIQPRHNSPIVTRAPLIGEHTFEVLHDILGLSEDEIADYAGNMALE